MDYIDELLQSPSLCEQLYTLIDGVSEDMASAAAQLKQIFIRASKQRQMQLEEANHEQRKISHE